MPTTIYRSRERPGISLYWLDGDHLPVDFTAAGSWSWTVTIEQDNVITTLTGAVITANSSPTRHDVYPGVPSLSLTFQAGAIDNLALGPALLRVIGMASGLDRQGEWPIVVKE